MTRDAPPRSGLEVFALLLKSIWWLSAGLVGLGIGCLLIWAFWGRSGLIGLGVAVGVLAGVAWLTPRRKRA